MHRRTYLAATLAVTALLPAAASAQSAAPVSPPLAIPHPLSQPFSGTWQTAPVTHADLQAIGFTDADLAWFDADQSTGASAFRLRLDDGHYSLSCLPVGGVVQQCDQGTYAVTPTEILTTSEGDHAVFDWSLAEGGLIIHLDEAKTLAATPGIDLRPGRAIYDPHPFLPVSAGVGPPTATTLPDGRYQTASMPVSVVKRALARAGFDPAFVDENWPGATTLAFRIDLDAGGMTETDIINDGPVSIGWRGHAELQDDHTLLATVRDGTYAAVLGYEIHLDGDTLTMRLTSDTDQDTGELSAQTAIYDTAPFTRVP